MSESKTCKALDDSMGVWGIEEKPIHFQIISLDRRINVFLRLRSSLESLYHCIQWRGVYAVIHRRNYASHRVSYSYIFNMQ